MEIDKYKYFESVLPFVKVSKIDLDDDIVKLSSLNNELCYYDIVLSDKNLLTLQKNITAFVNKEKLKPVNERNINPIFKIDDYIIIFHLQCLLIN